MSENQLVHRITTERAYYIAQVGRTLEIRARDTNTVLQVLEPPEEWGDDWLWSSCGFDGVRCVALDCICFVGTGVRQPSQHRAVTRDHDDNPPSCPPGAKTMGPTEARTAPEAPLPPDTITALRD
jgi:hypothetical protein